MTTKENSQNNEECEFAILEKQLEEEENLNNLGFELSRYSADGHSWNGKPMVNIWD